MKRRILLVFAFTALAGAGWSMWVNACDHDKQATSASAAATAADCPMHQATAATASGCSHGTTATAASASATTECSAHAMKVRGASASGCAAHGARTASAGGECGAHGAHVMGECLGHGMLTTANVDMHSDCDACVDMASCAQVLSTNGAQIQTVPLRNGVMFVYTTDTPAHVRAVQAAMARRTQRIFALEASGDRARLCPQCKSVRGAMASGKLTRETVNIEGGCLTLMTSSDPIMVAKLRSMAGTAGVARAIKS